MIHENSNTSREEEKKSGRAGDYRRRIHEFLARTPLGATDRYVMNVLGVTDANLVRPEITRLKANGLVREIGKVKCIITGRVVRLVTATDVPYAAREKMQAGTVTNPSPGELALDILRRLIEQGGVDHEGDFLLSDTWPDNPEGEGPEHPVEPAVITEAITLFESIGEPLKMYRNT